MFDVVTAVASSVQRGGGGGSGGGGGGGTAWGGESPTLGGWYGDIDTAGHHRSAAPRGPGNITRGYPQRKSAASKQPVTDSPTASKKMDCVSFLCARNARPTRRGSSPRRRGGRCLETHDWLLRSRRCRGCHVFPIVVFPVLKSTRWTSKRRCPVLRGPPRRRYILDTPCR